jgi:beta-carotene ketolase (CrtW type)
LSATTRRGLLLAAGIVLGWAVSLALVLRLDPASTSPLWLLLAVLVRTLLHTGLFIVGHDAMHGLLLPCHPALNRRLGQVVVLLYAALPYDAILANHRLHHRHAGTAADPDHHGGGSPHPLAWYRRFMAGYLAPGHVTALVGGWALLAAALQPLGKGALLQVLLFCTLPLLLSSLQLFLVGTYLPHRPRPGASATTAVLPHRATSLDLPVWLSLLSCYHFGYHHEHHAYPELAWHQLPAARLGRHTSLLVAMPTALQGSAIRCQ